MQDTDFRPNILLIHTDQHRADCLGVCGNPDVQTPCIDRLAGDGVLYRNSFCPFPICTPSRYSLLTGQYVHQHLGWTNHATLPAGLPTFPRVLRDAGYRTRAVGKMHFTPTYLDVGFQEMMLAEQDGPGRFDDDYHRWLREQGLVDRIDLMDQRHEYREKAPKEYWESVGAMTSDLDEAHHSTTWIADRAVESLERWGETGNLLMVGFIKPHHPFDPPAPWDSMYNPDRLTILPGWLPSPTQRDLERSKGYFPHENLTESKVRGAMAGYYATISQIDHHVGRMVEVLKRRGLYDDTLIVFTSDHGEYLGFHHLLLKGNYLYDPLVKVPLILKCPRPLPGPSGVVDDLVNNIDVAPTILAAVGTEKPESMIGRDLLGGGTSSDIVFAEAWRGKEYMARSETAKLLLCHDPHQSQFFDLQRDPLETENRIADPAYAAEIDMLRNRLLQWALFDAPTATYLDYDAPTTDAPNVPLRNDGHAKEIAEYFRRQMDHLTTSPSRP